MTGAQAIGGGQDGNAWNPANWQITYERQGLDEFSRIELSPTDQKYYSHTYRRDWQTGVWTRDGVIYFGEPIVLPVSHEGGKPDAIQMTSDGTITVHVNWISPLYPAPSELVVFNWSNVSAGSNNPPATLISAINAFEDPYIGPDANGVYRSEGQRYRTVPISGGHGQFTVSTSASAQSSGPLAAVFSRAHAHLAVPADRIVAIPNFSVPNFYYNGQGTEIPPFGYAQNKNEDPTDLTLDVGIVVVGANLGLYESPDLPSLFLGNWESERTHSTSHPAINIEYDFLGNPHSRVVANTSRISRSFGADDMLLLATGGVIEEEVFVSANDIAAAPRNAKLKLRYHAPIVKNGPSLSFRKYLRAITVKEVLLSPNAYFNYREESSMTTSFTESLTLTSESSITEGISDFINQHFGFSTSVTNSRTASLTRTKGFEVGYTNDNDFNVLVKYTRYPYHTRTIQPVLIYGDHGFQGSDILLHDTLESASVPSAEARDSFDTVIWERY